MNELQQYHFMLQTLSESGDVMDARLLLQRANNLFPEHIALQMSDGQTITYAALYRTCCSLTNYLRSKGITEQSRVLLLAENSIFFYIAYFGIWQTGAVIAPLNTFLHANELDHIISDINAQALIVSDALAEKLKEVTVPLPPIITESDIQTLLQRSQNAECTIHPVAPDALAALLYTSGTTGLPKGVMLSSRNIISNIAQALARFQFIKKERIFGALPLFHSFAQNTCIWSSFTVGATVILINKISRQSLLEGLALKPTVVLGVPGLYALLCRFPKVTFSKVRFFISGGDALPDKIRLFFALRFGRKICNGYGLTETSPFIAVDLEDIASPTNTVGMPFAEITCDIRNGAPVGTLWIKGPNIMMGYFNSAEATTKVLQDGWLDTGDLARIDKYGKIIICGRERDLIKNKGVAIYPQEIELVLMDHPAVLYAAVIGYKPDDTEGQVPVEEIPVAYLTLREPIEQIETLLQQYCAEHLAPYKIPRKFIIQKELPLTATGKVDKKALRKLTIQN